MSDASVGTVGPEPPPPSPSDPFPRPPPPLPGLGEAAGVFGFSSIRSSCFADMMVRKATALPAPSYESRTQRSRKVADAVTLAGWLREGAGRFRASALRISALEPAGWLPIASIGVRLRVVDPAVTRRLANVHVNEADLRIPPDAHATSIKRFSVGANLARIDTGDANIGRSAVEVIAGGPALEPIARE